MENTTVSQDPDPNPNTEIVFSSKRIPKHRRLRFEIGSNGVEYKKINSKKDQSRRLYFTPFPYYHDTTIEEVAHIRRTIKSSSKIARSFRFDLQSSRVFEQLSQEVRKIQGLKAFEFFSGDTSEANDITLKKAGRALKSLKYLQHLKMTMVECWDVNNQGMVDLAMTLRKLISLETLELSFNEAGDLDDEGVKALWRSFQHLRALKTLNISFIYCQGVAFYDIGNVERIFKGLKSLKEIKMDYSLTEQMGFESVQNIRSMLKVLTGLETINLCFAGCYGRNEWLEKLMEGFEGKPQLKKIILDLGRNEYLTNTGLESLKVCFKGLSQLEEIKIDLQGCEKITEEGREMLRESLQEISSLKDLEIKFE